MPNAWFMNKTNIENKEKRYKINTLYDNRYDKIFLRSRMIEPN